MTTSLPLSTPSIPTAFDPAFRDNFATSIENGILKAQEETITKTVNQNFADKELSRPKLKDYSEKLYAHGSVTGAVTIDLANGNHQSMTLTGNVTLTISNAPPTGEFGALFLYITQDGTGGRTVTFPAAFENTGGSNFSISGTTANTMTEVIAYTLNNGTLWRTKQGDSWT